MRYIIIPLVIILYIIWTIKSVKDIVKHSLWYCNEGTMLWLLLHFVALASFIIGLIIYYW